LERRLAFDLVLDKGTFDAISLSESGGRAEYIESAWKILSDDPSAVFLITSCNWVREELIQQFSASELFNLPVLVSTLAAFLTHTPFRRAGFEYKTHVRYPTFTFGGQTGQKICTVAFKKKL